MFNNNRISAMHLLLVLSIFLIFFASSGCDGEEGPTETKGISNIDNVENDNKIGNGMASVFTGVGNTPSNQLNDGYAVKSGNWIYYIDTQNGGNIWRMSPEGENHEKIAEGHYLQLNVSGDLIIANASYNSKVVQMNSDGSGEIVLAEEAPIDVVAKDGYIYYIDGIEGGLYSSQTSGGQTKLLIPDLWANFSISGNWIYYEAMDQVTGDTYVRRIPIEGGESQLISQPDNRIKMDSMMLSDDYLFYDLHGNVYDSQFHTYRYDIAEETTERLSHIYLTIFNVSDDAIYNIQNHPYGLARLSLDGRESEMLLPGSFAASINVAGDWLFFINNDENLRVTMMKTDGTQRSFVGEARLDPIPEE